MAKVLFDHIAPATNFESLPIRFIGTTSRGPAVTRLLLILPAMAVFFVPISLVIAKAAGEPSALSAMSERPLSVIQIALGVALWCGIFLLPIRDIVIRMGSRRTVAIDAGKIEVTDSTPFGTSSWTTQLSSYAGIAHHVRTSLSGLRHELILVHKDPAKNVLIAVADRIPQSTLDRAKNLLGLPEVPARSLYDRPVAA
ncbi:MAG: hypothetical protein ACKVP7_05055 [Hyphomicrobiaceae bacterium]